MSYASKLKENIEPSIDNGQSGPSQAEKKGKQPEDKERQVENKGNDYGLPDFHERFINDDDLAQFEKALNAPEALSLVAINDWRPIHQRVRKPGNRRKTPKAPRRTKDETREGYLYNLLKWPFLLFVLSWIVVLGGLYMATRLYIFLYEHFIAWTGKRQRLRRQLQQTGNYQQWKRAAQTLDRYLGNDSWKELDEYAYYSHATVNNVLGQLRRLRRRIQLGRNNDAGVSVMEEMGTLLEGCIRNNFVGVENPRLYSETYYGTKHLVQEFVDEVHVCLKLVLESKELSDEWKYNLLKDLDRNYGRTVLCLSGGATFAYYHFGVVKALLDNEVLPDIISGTSGGALVAAMVATRTDDELKRLLVPELAYKITACSESLMTGFNRWRKTGARFDLLDWAEKCSWFCRGSTTFREAYERTGRILNVSCVPSNPHSPTILANYLTSPNCVIWSAVIASAAVPGILNPVVLMMKKPDGTLAPYSFGHKWKDGSLRTDIPLKALDTHFNASFPIVSQVNPHISLFFFSSRGSVGRPVTHRRGRGWRGGFLGSAVEQYIKLDLNKWLKVLRHLELLPRPLGQDWSEIWLQRFDGTVTIWPKSKASDLWYILSDPSVSRLGRMIREGEQSAFPKIKFIGNRMKVERLIAEGLRRCGGAAGADQRRRGGAPPVQPRADGLTRVEELEEQNTVDLLTDAAAGGSEERNHEVNGDESDSRRSSAEKKWRPSYGRRRDSVMDEIKRQSAVFFDDTDDTGISEEEHMAFPVPRAGTKID